LFHALGPATAKALSPGEERRVAGTTRANYENFRYRPQSTARRYFSSNRLYVQFQRKRV